MKILRSPLDMQAAALEACRAGNTIALVPTMGALHEGHLSLVRLARSHGDLVVVSIFVNPTQFAPSEDLATYPRNIEHDEALCRAQGVDILFYPSEEDIYFSDSSCTVDETKLSAGLCGASRAGHFQGVCTVVTILFNVVQPTVAVFGQKDAQQARIIRRLVRDLHFPTRIVLGPTIREHDGLAMSSRNASLSPEGRRAAACLSRALGAASDLFLGGETAGTALLEKVRNVLAAEPLAEIDYVEIVDDVTLEPVEVIARPALIALAARIEGTRLIDNTVIRPGAVRQSP